MVSKFNSFLNVYNIYKNGKHIDEVNFNLEPMNKTDKSGGHNLDVK